MLISGHDHEVSNNPIALADGTVKWKDMSSVTIVVIRILINFNL